MTTYSLSGYHISETNQANPQLSSVVLRFVMPEGETSLQYANFGLPRPGTLPTVLFSNFNAYNIVLDNQVLDLTNNYTIQFGQYAWGSGPADAQYAYVLKLTNTTTNDTSEFQIGGTAIGPFSTYSDYTTFKEGLAFISPVTGSDFNSDTPLDMRSFLSVKIRENDTITGDIFSDSLNGGKGKDLIYGNDGDDMLYGGVGADTLFGGNGNDALYGDTQDDILKGMAGNDSLLGGGGNDRLFGNNGRDLLNGGGGDDKLSGGNGNDRLKGANGDDLLNGDKGNDRLWGGNGNDTLKGNQGKDVLRGGDGNDRLEGGLQDDRLFGGNNNDQIFGGTGNDSLDGGAGYDNIYGEDGDDRISGGDDLDNLYGGDGNDTISGDGGDDNLDGGKGNDVLNGGFGNDQMLGGIGADVFVFGTDRRVGNDVISDFDVTEDTIKIESVDAVYSITATANGTDTVLSWWSSSVTLRDFDVADFQNINFDLGIA